jgi:hypothetical protein
VGDCFEKNFFVCPTPLAIVVGDIGDMSVSSFSTEHSTMVLPVVGKKHIFNFNHIVWVP